ncbi:hypothetical protein PV721_27940 [Streptomyces sp. MB09-01]|uniref:hypothetical protein n=1 Tax=Streptomyces sp. MB09-01 TaxID=3028666 RepID=UPI0029B4EFAE|nr:hypothetical protein [Streptomyces sp. MB09-01]MDX3538117.1 hypothetical protein [Streptomyces sp. MB09-01]
MAKTYGAGKTSWSDYRSGSKIIPLDLLKRVIFGRVRDDRGRSELWTRARGLHAAACAAEEGRAGSDGGRKGAPETWEMLQRAQRQADAELAQSEEALRTLLGLTVRLQKELDDALAQAESGPAVSAGPAPEAPPHKERRGDGASADRDAHVPGTELVLWTPGPPALRGLGDAVVRIGAEAEVRMRQISCLRDEVRHLREPCPTPVSGGLVRREAHVPAGWEPSKLPALPLRSRILRGARDPRRLRRVLLLTAIVLALSVPATSLEQLRHWASPSVAEPVTTFLPEAGSWQPSAGSPPAAGPPAPGSAPPQGSAGNTTSPPASASPFAAPSPSSSPGVPGPGASNAAQTSPGGPVDVPAPTGSGVYAITEDGSEVVQWSGTDWVGIGGPAAELYAGPAGVFATDPGTGDLRGYSGKPGRWSTVSGRAADFAISGRDLYRLAQDRSAVHRWDRGRATWTRVGGPAGRLYGGGAGLFATDPVDGRIFAYGGKGEAWSYAGTAGADFVVTDQHLYGLNPDRSAVFRWSGEAGVWSAVGGPAAALYASSSELYAANGADSGMWRYRAGAWTRVGEAGTAFGARGERLYRLDKDRSAVWERNGAAWQRIGGPVRALVVAG